VVLRLLPQTLHQAGRVVELVPEREVPAVHLALAGEVAGDLLVLEHQAVPVAHHEGGGHVDQRNVETPAELDGVANAVGVDLQPHLERWVEGDEPGAVDDDVHLAAEHLELRVGEPEERVGDVPVQDPAPLEDEGLRLLVAAVVAQWLEGLAPDHLLREAGVGAGGRAAPHQRPDPTQHLPVAVEEHGEGHLAQKSGAAGQENTLAGEGIGHGEHGRFHRVRRR